MANTGGDYLQASEDLRKVFSERMKTARGERSLYSVAKATGISYSALWLYQKGETLPSTMSILAVADELDVSVDWLLGRCEKRKRR